MANMNTVALTSEQYKKVITCLYNGENIQQNIPVATALQIEANTGIRIGDVLSLKRGDIIEDGGKYRFDITEQKTGKKRIFVVPAPVYNMIEEYCRRYNIGQGEQLFTFGERNVQKILKKLSDRLGIDRMSTHSFRKYFGTKAYKESNYDIELVRRLYQHSSAAVTSRYIGITDKRTEGVINACVSLI